MSNANLVRRLETLLRQLEAGEITLSGFAEQFSTHVEALDNMEYSAIKAAQMAAVQFEIDGDNDADGFGDHDEMVASAAQWGRNWLASVAQK